MARPSEFRNWYYDLDALEQAFILKGTGYREIAKEAGIKSAMTVWKFLHGGPTHQSHAKKIIFALGLNPKDVLRRRPGKKKLMIAS